VQCLDSELLQKALQVSLFQIRLVIVFMLCILVYQSNENSAVKAFVSSQVGFAVGFGHCLRS
jgi:hypothetical protein